MDNVSCADNGILTAGKKIVSVMQSNPIIRQIDAPVPLLMIFKKYTVLDEETRKPNYLLKLLNVDHWVKHVKRT